MSDTVVVVPEDVTENVVVEQDTTTVVTVEQQGPQGPTGPGGFTYSEDNTGRVLTSDDFNKAICCNSASDQTFTLPSSVDSDDLAKEIRFFKLGTGRLTIQAPAGTTIFDSTSGGTIYCSSSSDYYQVTLQLVSLTKYVITSVFGPWTTT